MNNKKRILRRMAAIGLVVLVVSGVLFLAGDALYHEAQQKRRADIQAQREEEIQKYRGYLAETAKRIKSIPVDPNIVGQAQARYFEDSREVRTYLWAMDNRGEFVFGVPNEAFARLNAGYDKYAKQIQEEGRFTDRQDFLRSLIETHRRLDMSRYEPGEGKESRQWHNWENDDEGLVFSAPFQDQRGQMLGNVYLKMTGLQSHSEFSNTMEGPLAISGVLFVGSLLFLWFLLPTWVYLDAHSRGMQSPWKWSALALVSLFIGLAIYLIVRPEPGESTCKQCGKTASGATYCPYCGTPAENEFCPKCGYPAKTEWSYCPNCQSALRHTVADADGAYPQPSGAD